MIDSRHFIPLKHLRAVLRLGQLSRYAAKSSVKVSIGGHSIKAKEISYRGGVVVFPLPEDWKEEYEPSGGGTFYEDVPKSGTLHLNVLGFKTPSDAEIPKGFKAFRDGLLLRIEKQIFEEDGEEWVLLSWQVGYKIDPHNFRIANFTYTIETALLETDQSRYEQSVVQTILELAEFGRELGETGDYQHSI